MKRSIPYNACDETDYSYAHTECENAYRLFSVQDYDPDSRAIHLDQLIHDYPVRRYSDHPTNIPQILIRISALHTGFAWSRIWPSFFQLLLAVRFPLRLHLTASGSFCTATSIDVWFALWTSLLLARCVLDYLQPAFIRINHRASVGLFYISLCSSVKSLPDVDVRAINCA